MARLDLRKAAGIPISLNEGEILFDGFTYQTKRSYGLEHIKNELLNDDVHTPENISSTYFGIDHDEVFFNKGMNLNLTVLMPNMLGIEFLKTRSKVRKNTHTIIDVLLGGGVLIQQNFSDSDNGTVYITNLKKGSKAIIFSGYDYVLSNTKSTPLVYFEVTSLKSDSINQLDDMKGMSYYVIRKNAKQEIVRNPIYKEVNKPTKINFDKVLTKLGITLKTPIIKQILRKYEKFTWFFNNSSITI